MHRHPRHRLRPIGWLLAAAVLSLTAAGCGGPPRAPATAQPVSEQPATARLGDITIHATATQTSALGPGTARDYGIEREDGTILLLVALRRGPEGAEASVPAAVTASAVDLRGGRQAIELRPLRSGDLLDYVGTTRISLPDTLRFEIDVEVAGSGRTSVQFEREFFAR